MKETNETLKEELEKKITDEGTSVQDRLTNLSTKVSENEEKIQLISVGGE